MAKSKIEELKENIENIEDITTKKQKKESKKSEITNDTFIKVISNTIGSFSFEGNDEKKYTFSNIGNFKSIKMSVLVDLVNNNPVVFEDGYLILENKEEYEFLDLDLDVIATKIIKKEEIDALLDLRLEDLEYRLAELSDVCKEQVVIRAKEIKLDSLSKIKIIKKCTGFDISPMDFDE